MRASRRPSRQTTAVLQAFESQPSAWRYGYEFIGDLRIKSGSLYPILIRLTERGWLETRWETDMPLGRPPRHLYRLSPQGLAYVRAHLRSARAATRRPGLLEA
ncbi:PadR family transcriptional regulator [Microlunatus ginsengisoli]|uniref:PadR family transcriptional regulator n=1 Tax=Microlunatus ginsengisoli TaxID=363863 RepID=A0ABP7AML2_9ACTN